MESSNEILIKIKTLNSTTIPLKIYTNETIGGLKNKIFQKIRVSVINQRLIFQGKMLQNDKQISDYKIEESDVIHLVETDNRNYQPPPSSSSITNSDNTQTQTNPYLAIFNSIFTSHPTSQNNTQNLSQNDTEGIYDSFKHILYPSTFNLQNTTEIITQSINSIYNLIDTSNFLNFDNSARIKNLYQNNIGGLEFKVGQWIDIRDQNLQWIEGQIIEVKDKQVKVHYIGTSSRMNEWIGTNSDRLALFRTYTAQENKLNEKYSSAHPNKEDPNPNDTIHFTKVKKFSCISNDIIIFLDVIKEKITRILNQKEVLKHNRFDSKDALFDNERYEMLMIMQLYPLLDKFGRLLTDMAYYLMNTSFNYYTDNIYLFRKNIYDESLRFMNIYDTSETVMKNRLAQYQNLTKYSILRTSNNGSNAYSNSHSENVPRIGYIVNVHSYQRTREEEREEQMRRARRFIVGRENFTIEGKKKRMYDNGTQTTIKEKRMLDMDKGVERFCIQGVVKKDIIEDKKTALRKSITKEKYVIEAKSKAFTKTSTQSTSFKKGNSINKSVRYKVDASKGTFFTKKK